MEKGEITMDLNTKRLNRKIKEVKEINTYSESAIIIIDDAIQEAHKFIEQLQKLREIQEKYRKTI